MLNKHWQEKTIISFILLPFSMIYYIIYKIRLLMYQLGLAKSIKWNIPIVVVGNISVGGAGKTPLVCELVNVFKKKGYKPGIISRGYGGSSRGPDLVTIKSHPSIVGDEPVLFAHQLDVPIVVAKKRNHAVKEIIKYNVNLIFSDDGLQHYSMGRAIDIVVHDVDKGYGNGFLLPAGPLREPISRLSSFDIIVTRDNDQATQGHRFESSILTANNILTNEQINLEVFQEKNVHAVAGIRHPERFFDNLRELGLTITEHAFSDHYKYSETDFISFENDHVLMTQKDAVKCKSFAKPTWWIVDHQVNILPDLIDEIEHRVKSHIND